MTTTIKNEVVKRLQRTRGVKDIEFVTDNKLKVVISNRNTDFYSEVEKAYVDLKLDGLVDGYMEIDTANEAFITINEQICKDPKFTEANKAFFRLDVLEYAFYKKELEGTDYESLMGNTPNPLELLEIIKNNLYKDFDNYPFTINFTIYLAIESLLKTYYYYNGTYDFFETYGIELFKKDNENADEYLKYADKIVESMTNEHGEIKSDETANLVIVTLAIALAQVLRENNMSIFNKFRELI